MPEKRRQNGPAARGALLALPWLSRRRSERLADDPGGGDPRRRLEVAGVLRGRADRALQPERRLEREDQPRREDAGEGEGVEGEALRVAGVGEGADADEESRVQSIRARALVRRAAGFIRAGRPSPGADKPAARFRDCRWPL